MSTTAEQFNPAGHAPPPPAYPVRVEAAHEPDPRLSRWLWLVKWLLLIPHGIVLAFLWLAFVVLTVVAFFAILVTGHYPRAIFDFNVGVLRWTWRVHYYGYGALATDRYPPFTLGDVPDYPARLDVAYPERLSRGLVLVKSWLLAIPHYLVLAVLLGWGPTGTEHRFGDATAFMLNDWPGLIQILVLVVAVVLLFAGRYPRGLYDLIVGLDRWALRVAAYAALMTDRYPPFHLHQGGGDPSSPPTDPLDPESTNGVDAAPRALPTPPAAAAAAGPGARGWRTGRIVAVVVGAVFALGSLGLLAAGGVGLWVDQHARDGQYLTSPTRTLRTDGYALTSERFTLGSGVVDLRTDWDEILGTIRVRATSTDPAKRVFLGIAPTGDVNRYVDGVSYSVVRPDGDDNRRDHPGGPLSTPPTRADIWTVSTSGPGEQALIWEPRDGDWTLVIANEDGAAGVAARTDLGATVPDLGTWSTIALGIGGGLLLLGALLIAVPVYRATHHPATDARDHPANGA
ncbi:DUF4389 domain-containing protein [Frankia sp. CNm7]|uniref:DUF4389 domain-containing protein n=1 Tax=Frankia nepalensis TaxID=1836974 RepID=A0A937UNL8_9ACTN|nr:DUF4389 domain-containing protein [Frankia nepalensis]MBL7499369.1 DUF4389 domain-containing protein [Frankia nepalensis]MBL7516070.1 DUF4389 domain-containing protein [Frankia nepalensis]MBL7521831.1 DUF4389 domain-containing protein [Frankia nepalensis]MBL7626385.1 DUF4389 domain-containing protein [Frankia nepalensis]